MSDQMIQFESEGSAPAREGDGTSGLFIRDLIAQPAMHRVPWRALVGLTLLLQLYLLISLVLELRSQTDVFPPVLHALTEVLATSIALLVVLTQWHAQADHRLGNLQVLACIFLPAAALNLMHLAFYSTHLAASLNASLLARYLMAGALVVAALLPAAPLRLRGRNLGYCSLLAGSAVMAAVLCWLVWQVPQSWQAIVADTGSLELHISAEYGVIFIALAAAVLLYRRTAQPQSWDAASLFAAAIVIVLGELSFADPGAPAAMLLAHVYKVIVCYFIYRAVVSSSVAEPYRRVRAALIESKSAEHMVEFLAYHDPLTKLPNRMLLRERVQRAIAHANYTKTKTVFFHLDLDNFKTVNDTLGHAAGDVLLQRAAERLGECVDNGDTLARPGGDEFVIVWQDVSDVESVLPRMTHVMDMMQQPFEADGRQIALSASAGIALYPDDGGDFETLMKKADMAMYSAKQAGRNIYRFFDARMDSAALDLLRIRNDLRMALERGEFLLHYQPQYDIATGNVVGAEALIRWQHPELGLVLPSRFISVAEECGLIVPIGDWVMREACRQAMEWRNAGLPPLVMAVNLSAVQFMRGDVEKSVVAALNESGLRPSLLELELTESILMQDTDTVLATVRRLKGMGVKLSIDDFGTGYSSLSYLRRFAVDRLKVDRSFVHDLAINPDDAAIVRAVIQMAHSLGLITVAEGVEDARVLHHLKSLQCDQVQGYYFARPMSADEFGRFLADASTNVVSVNFA